MSCEFFHDIPIKSVRKRHRCDWCFEQIETGQPAVKNSQVFEGEFNCFYLHPECSEALHNSTLDDWGWEPGEQKRGQVYGYED
jgi:hypothetical protein